MMTTRRSFLATICLLSVLGQVPAHDRLGAPGVTAIGTLLQASDPLPSWNEGPAKKSILDFVAKTTTAGSADFVPVPERIAVFDNDGTLWSEQPMYVQLAFVVDRVKLLAETAAASNRSSRSATASPCSFVCRS